jgi:hypothetical protein
MDEDVPYECIQLDHENFFNVIREIINLKFEHGIKVNPLCDD